MTITACSCAMPVNVVLCQLSISTPRKDPDNPKAAAFGQNAILDTSCTNQATQKQSNKKQMIQINDALSVV